MKKIVSLMICVAVFLLPLQSNLAPGYTKAQAENASASPVLLVDQTDSVVNRSSYTVSGAVNEQCEIKISVNGYEVASKTTTSTLKFSAVISLPSKMNAIEVTAKNNSGNISKKYFHVLYDDDQPEKYYNKYEKELISSSELMIVKYDYSQTAYSRDRVEFKSSDGKTAAIIENTANGFVYINPDNTYSTIITDYDISSKHQFMLMLNTVSHKADVFFDGMRYLSQVPFYSEVSDISKIECKSTSNQTPIFFIDNISVTLPNIVVAKDGTGDFDSVQSAIDSIPENNTDRIIIYVKSGEYNERVKVPKNKKNISLIGEDRETTKIVYNIPASANMDNRGTTVLIQGEGFNGENITFENSYGRGSQALAMTTGADKIAFFNCGFIGCQDTLYADGRNYYENCYIKGDVDFIYGPGFAIFNKCTIYSQDYGYITAANTDINQPYGFIFLNCTLQSNVTQKTTYLGRPWRQNAQIVYKNCYLGFHIKDEGWTDMHEATAEKARFYEYQNVGPGAVVNESRRQLDSEEGDALTIEYLFGGVEDWEPRISVYYTPVKPKKVNNQNVNFSDIKGHWAENIIKDFAQKGLLSGMPDGTFRPNSTLTYGEIVSIFVRALNISTAKGTTDHWADIYIDAAKNAGLVMNGEISNNDAPCTREYAAVLAARALKYKREALPVKEDIDEESSYIIDWSSVKNVEDVKLCTGAGIIAGKTTGKPGQYMFDPSGLLTRAEGAAIVMRIIDPSKRTRVSDL